MPKILAVRVENRLIELITPQSGRFGRLFEIESLNLLVGKNGSGKTKILTSIANARSSPQDEEVQFYFGTMEAGETAGEDRTKNSCVIYYSALPYKRPLNRGSGVYNASPSGEIKDDFGRIENLGEIARALGIRTRLTAVLGYTRAVFRALLLPVLRDVEHVADPKLLEMLRKLRKLETQLESGSDAISVNRLDHQRELILKKIENHLDDELSARIGEPDKFFFLTVLEYMQSRRETYEADQAATNFLNHLGLLGGSVDINAFNELELLVENTRSVFLNYSNLEDFEWDERTCEFQVDEIPGLAAIQASVTPIRIEWSNLSSGLQALIEQFSLIEDALREASEQGHTSVLLLVDEGDAYLHLEWQRQYISLLNKFLGAARRKYEIRNLQVIMATHSPILAADIPGEFVTSLDGISNIATFAAPLEDVILGSFESSSLGQFAADKINGLYSRALASKLTLGDKYLIGVIGDTAIKSALKRKIEE
ncbi:AAA family ATPase [Pseudomonas syringae]|uniref:AAA family ATPase n=1 Tax=Pseudomonas syringae TaxID=317 RepID=UPI000CD24BBF|nr:AAA family ATPase [Pseudomonas syringae]POD54616.1 hypothetical protein BKM15_05615 [Pseudomonas syringae pv. syringae]MCF5732956.1 AAA family ATPase [Pseudomonas syringae]MCF5738831.1 AAA family ATPase [Pseudomonas syringae]MCF5751836.1 AAA family ATPase [Pseudomonas syringae]MCF5757845.1 AAA family ATPase [Pseudomonas syringae]